MQGKFWRGVASGLPISLSLWAAIFLILWIIILSARPSLSQSPLSTQPGSVAIVTGGTYQTIFSINARTQSATIVNNNNTVTNTNSGGSDLCWIDVTGCVQTGDTLTTSRTCNGITLEAAQRSIPLVPGGSYGRYYPYIPLGPTVGTCQTSGDTVYADSQP